jgi:hypothetical protein
MINNTPGHSADISMSLLSQGHVFAVREIGPAELILSEPARINPGRAELVIQIDGDERRCAVVISRSTQPKSDIVSYVAGPN